VKEDRKKKRYEKQVRWDRGEDVSYEEEGDEKEEISKTSVASHGMTWWRMSCETVAPLRGSRR
jgi:hypothetical protein